MSSSRYCVISGVLFALVALTHLLRIAYGISIQVDDYAVPMVVSWIGVLVPGALALWALRLARSAVDT